MIDNQGMFEIIDIDGKPRFALREGLTANDLFEFMEEKFAERVERAVEYTKRVFGL